MVPSVDGSVGKFNTLMESVGVDFDIPYRSTPSTSVIYPVGLPIHPSLFVPLIDQYPSSSLMVMLAPADVVRGSFNHMPSTMPAMRCMVNIDIHQFLREASMISPMRYMSMSSTLTSSR